jgi:hypothetical protein
VEYSVGFPNKNAAVTSAIARLAATVWTPAVTADGEVREHADVAEITGLLDLSGVPRAWVIVCREHPHPGAQMSLLETHDGYRYQSFATNTASDSLGSWRPGTAPMPASMTESRQSRTPGLDVCLP